MMWLKYPGLWIEIKEPKVKQRQYLTFTRRMQIYNFIKTIGKASGEFWEYQNGWSDQRVAEQFEVSHGNVVTVRQELGKLKTYSGAPYAAKLKDLETMVIRHEEHIAVLYANFKELEEKYNKLRLKEHFQA
jgi:hypothetical protein